MADKNLYHDCAKVKMYLNRHRRIGISIVQFLINEHLLFQEMQTNNALFIIRDEHNDYVGAETQGIYSKRYKCVKPNTRDGYGFNVRFSANNTFDRALFFESAVDLMSYIDFKLNFEKKSLKGDILISMAGLNLNILQHSLTAFGEPNAVLCVDNDSAGKRFKNKVKAVGINYADHPPDERYNDWNEQLAAARQGVKPIGRLLRRAEIDNIISGLDYVEKGKREKEIGQPAII